MKGKAGPNKIIVLFYIAVSAKRAYEMAILYIWAPVFPFCAIQIRPKAFKNLSSLFPP